MLFLHYNLWIVSRVHLTTTSFLTNLLEQPIYFKMVNVLQPSIHIIIFNVIPMLNQWELIFMVFQNLLDSLGSL